MEQIEIAIRWRDVDNYGHVNNAVYLTYLEECRDRWVRRTLGDDVGFVIVRVAIDFRRELSLEDGSVTVACRGIGYGTSSIRTAETIRARAGWIAAESESVIVAHDAAGRKSRPITDRGALGLGCGDRGRPGAGQPGRICRPNLKCWRYQPSPTHMIVTPPGELLESSENPLPM